jgi:hypothetical protein
VLNMLTRSAETAKATGIGRQALLVLVLELLDEVVDEAAVEVFSTKVGVTGGCLDLKDTLLDNQERYTEGFSSQVENENVPFAGNRTR